MSSASPPTRTDSRTPSIFPGQKVDSESVRGSKTLAADSDQRKSQNSRGWALMPMLLPLAFHSILSVAIAITVSYFLDNRHFYLERNPMMRFADGNITQLSRYHILQSDVITILSASLTALRWATNAWTGPLCWHVIFLLAKTHGLTRRDINWVVGWGLLPPSTNFRHPINLLLGLVLLATVATYPASPLLTGSIAWIPSSGNYIFSTQDEFLFYNLVNASDPRNISDPLFQSVFFTDVVGNINTAWGTDSEKNVYKRVVPSVTTLNVNSTVGEIPIPYYTILSIEWISDHPSDSITKQLEDMLSAGPPFQNLHLQIQLPGAIALIVNSTAASSDSFEPPPKWLIAINVSRDKFLEKPNCNNNASSITNSADGRHIQSHPFHSNITRSNATSLRTRQNADNSDNHDIDQLIGFTTHYCLAFAYVSYNATYGGCANCRVGSYSVVQNTTELALAVTPDRASQAALRSLPQIIPTLTPLRTSLPGVSADVESYVSAVMTRAYSALWTTWTDINSEDTISSPGVQVRRKNAGRSKYTPAYPTLKAEVDQVRVYSWLAIQLLILIAALIFLWLHSNLSGRFIKDLNIDTDMIALDIDSTTAPLPGYSTKDELKANLWIEPNELKDDYGWRLTTQKSR